MPYRTAEEMKKSEEVAWEGAWLSFRYSFALVAPPDLKLHPEADTDSGASHSIDLACQGQRVIGDYLARLATCSPCSPREFDTNEPGLQAASFALSVLPT